MSIVRSSIIAMIITFVLLAKAIGQELIPCETDSDCPFLPKCTANYLALYKRCSNGVCVCEGPGLDINCENYCDEASGMLCHGYCIGGCGEAHCVPQTCECYKLCGSECERDADCPKGYVCDKSTCKCVLSTPPTVPTTTTTTLPKKKLWCPDCPPSCGCIPPLICYGYDDSQACCEDSGYWWNVEFNLCCGDDKGEKTPNQCDTGKVGTEDCLCCGYVNTPLNPYIEFAGERIVLYEGDLGTGETSKTLQVNGLYSINFEVENVEPNNAVDWDTKFWYDIVVCETVE